MSNDNDNNDSTGPGNDSTRWSTRREAGAFTAGGAIGGLATSAILGKGGLAIAGTAVAVGAVPFLFGGAMVGAAAYGLKCAFFGGGAAKN